jgi:hypothetical protein
MSDEFFISRDGLHSLSRAFNSEAEKIGEELAKFKPKTDGEAIHDGFGVLTESEQVTASYIDLAAHISAAVSGLQRHLHAIADGIDKNAANTEAADEKMSHLFNGAS